MNRFDAWVREVGEDPDPRFTLANERTFLSWMTTALGLLGVGLAVGTIIPEQSRAITIIASLWIIMAVIICLRAVMRWFRLERAMRRSEGLPLSSSIPMVALSLVVLALASGVAILAAR